MCSIRQQDEVRICQGLVFSYAHTSKGIVECVRATLPHGCGRLSRLQTFAMEPFNKGYHRVWMSRFGQNGY